MNSQRKIEMIVNASFPELVLVKLKLKEGARFWESYESKIGLESKVPLAEDYTRIENYKLGRQMIGYLLTARGWEPSFGFEQISVESSPDSDCKSRKMGVYYDCIESVTVVKQK